MQVSYQIRRQTHDWRGIFAAQLELHGNVRAKMVIAVGEVEGIGRVSSIYGPPIDFFSIEARIYTEERKSWMHVATRRGMPLRRCVVLGMASPVGVRASEKSGSLLDGSSTAWSLAEASARGYNTYQSDCRVLACHVQVNCGEVNTVTDDSGVST